MEYLLLVLTVGLGALKSIMTKLAKTKNTNLRDTTKINLISFSCALVVIFLLGIQDLGSPFSVPIWLALFYAVCTLASQLCLMKAVELGPVSISSLFYSCGFIIPTIWGNVFYQEGIHALHIVGIVLIVASFILSSQFKRGKRISIGWVFAALGGTLFSGLVGVIQKLFTNNYSAFSLNYFLYVAFAFIIAINLLLFLVAQIIDRRKKTVQGPAPEEEITEEGEKTKTGRLILFTIFLGCIIGLVNKINTYLSGVFPSIIVFPIINGGAILLSAVLSKFIFKEKLKAIQWVGIMVGILGIVLLALGQMYV